MDGKKYMLIEMEDYNTHLEELARQRNRNVILELQLINRDTLLQWLKEALPYANVDMPDTIAKTFVEEFWIHMDQLYRQDNITI